MAMQEPPQTRPTSAEAQGIVEKAWDVQHRLEARVKNMGKGKYGRVLMMARKPDQEEFNQTAKVTAVGMLLIGALGFTIYFVMGPLLHIGA